MTALTAGSLCTGYGGLELGLTAAGLTHTLAFVADPDPGAARLLAEHHPGVPNLGDITAVDWPAVDVVIDILFAGYPCQGFSLAGQRKGMDDERFIWPHVADGIRRLRPRHVVLENVPGHLSLGFGRVLGDLAALGYVGSWICLRASDIGAPHRRDRIFIYAHLADTPGLRLGNRGAAGITGIQAAPIPGRTGPLTLLPTPEAKLSGSGPDYARMAREGSGGDDLTTALFRVLSGVQVQHVDPINACAIRDGIGIGRPPTRHELGTNAQECLTNGPLDVIAGGVSHVNGGDDGGQVRGDDSHAAQPLCRQIEAQQPAQRIFDWQVYAPAIHRWETVLGRPAPHPTAMGPKGGQRLDPRFVEWLMGLDDGWVTAVPGLTRIQALRLLGNGVVPQQGAAAIALLAGPR